MKILIDQGHSNFKVFAQDHGFLHKFSLTEWQKLEEFLLNDKKITQIYWCSTSKEIFHPFDHLLDSLKHRIILWPDDFNWPHGLQINYPLDQLGIDRLLLAYLVASQKLKNHNDNKLILGVGTYNTFDMLKGETLSPQMITPGLFHMHEKYMSSPRLAPHMPSLQTLQDNFLKKSSKPSTQSSLEQGLIASLLGPLFMLHQKYHFHSLIVASNNEDEKFWPPLISHAFSKLDVIYISYPIFKAWEQFLKA